MTTGLQRLELWSAMAGQIERNQVYDALFAVADKSVFWRYVVLRDGALGAETTEWFVMVREDLIVKVALKPDSFGIRYIGSRDDAPGLDTAVEVL